MIAKPHILILGGGPAGLGAAFHLTHPRLARVTVSEPNPWVGGNAASFDLVGTHVDYGNHRLHPTCAPKELENIHSPLLVFSKHVTDL